MALDDKIPKINDIFSLVGESELKGKFIQLYVDEVPYLRIANDATTHNHLLRSFIKECQIAGEKIGSERELEELEWDFSACAPLSMQKYHVVGMGQVRINKKSNSIVFEGNSFDYGLTPNREHFTKIEIYLHGWNLTVGVD